jgi:hypothetical protein
VAAREGFARGRPDVALAILPLHERDRSGKGGGRRMPSRRYRSRLQSIECARRDPQSSRTNDGRGPHSFNTLIVPGVPPTHPACAVSTASRAPLGLAALHGIAAAGTTTELAGWFHRAVAKQDRGAGFGVHHHWPSVWHRVFSSIDFLGRPSRALSRGIPEKRSCEG